MKMMIFDEFLLQKKEIHQYQRWWISKLFNYKCQKINNINESRCLASGQSNDKKNYPPSPSRSQNIAVSNVENRNVV